MTYKGLGLLHHFRGEFLKEQQPLGEERQRLGIGAVKIPAVDGLNNQQPGLMHTGHIPPHCAQMELQFLGDSPKGHGAYPHGLQHFDSGGTAQKPEGMILPIHHLLGDDY